MRIVHTADLHLGFRQFDRFAKNGMNQREADVAQTFTALVDRIIALAPEVVLIAGDVFHTVRPTNSTVVFALEEFGRLQRALPATVVIMIAGNHDTPKTAETGSILKAFEHLGIVVVDRDARRLNFPALELSVLAVPESGTERPALDPDPAYRYNVLLLHGEVQGMMTGAAKHLRMPHEITHEAMGLDRWDYIALGHYHVYKEIAPNAFYSGSIDYTSTDPWGELVEQDAATLPGKGFAVRDLETGEQTFYPLPASRPYVELPSIDCAGLHPPQIDALISAAVHDCACFDRSVSRIVIRNITRLVARELNAKALRDYRSRALNFGLALRGPEPKRLAPLSAGRRGQPIDMMIRSMLVDRFPEANEADRAQLLALADKYLAEVEGRNPVEAAHQTANDANDANDANAVIAPPEQTELVA